jgi:hypothetical protein
MEGFDGDLEGSRKLSAVQNFFPEVQFYPLGPFPFASPALLAYNPIRRIFRQDGRHIRWVRQICPMRGFKAGG